MEGNEGRETSEDGRGKRGKTVVIQDLDGEMDGRE